MMDSDQLSTQKNVCLPREKGGPANEIMRERVNKELKICNCSLI